jgi:hypothetical protein
MAEQVRERRAYRLAVERERTKQRLIAHDRDALVWRELSVSASSEQAKETR